ncbi:MAG: MBL fold metallo-hydrolase [Treponema sp.]|jgi:ribonuclease BN (tRNA processing enzyme)|nr:MBL fold metallo-hydrolase [Treponema sp.]
MQTKFFTTRLVAENTTQIRGTAYENAYLIEGASRALLIDTLTGAGNLAAFCRELTDLPLQVALTHGHADHAGGCFDFGVCSMHPHDIRFLYDDSTVEHRRSFITRANRASASQNAASVQMRDLTPPCALKSLFSIFYSLFSLIRRKNRKGRRERRGKKEDILYTPLLFANSALFAVKKSSFLYK